MRGCERLELVRILFGAEQRRIGIERHVVASRIVELRDEADVGAGRRVTEQEFACARSSQNLQRWKSFVDPMRVPAVDFFLRMAELALQIFEHSEVVQRVDVAGDRHRHRHDVRTLGGGRGQKRLVGEAEIEVIDDRQALRQAVPVDLEHRHEALRVERAIVVRPLLAVEQVHGTLLIIHALEVERDPHPIAGGRTVIIVEDDPAHGAGCLL